MNDINLHNLKMFNKLKGIYSLPSTTRTVNHLSISQCCPLLPRYPPHCSCTAIRLYPSMWRKVGMIWIGCY